MTLIFPLCRMKKEKKPMFSFALKKSVFYFFWSFLQYFHELQSTFFRPISIRCARKLFEIEIVSVTAQYTTRSSSTWYQFKMDNTVLRQSQFRELFQRCHICLLVSERYFISHARNLCRSLKLYKDKGFFYMVSI